MNKITRLTIAALCGSMMLSVSGCNSLDQMPTNKFTDDSFWSSADRAQSVLNMAYSQMYSHDKIWQDESLSDNMYELKGSPDSHTIRAGLANASLGLFESEWKWLYQGIKTTNVFMDKIDLVPDMDADAKAGMIAQIRFIRAYLYFRAVNFYGAVPFFRRVFFGLKPGIYIIFHLYGIIAKKPAFNNNLRRQFYTARKKFHGNERLCARARAARRKTKIFTHICARGY